MKIAGIVVLLLTLGMMMLGQGITFTDSQGHLIVNKGAVVRMQNDSVHIISHKRAMDINQQLNRLDTLRVLYADKVKVTDGILKALDDYEYILSKLEVRVARDSTYMNFEMNDLVKKTGVLLEMLERHNEELRDNNVELILLTETMERDIKSLRQQTRFLWFDGIYDKLIALGIGIGIGALIVGL